MNISVGRDLSVRGLEYFVGVFGHRGVDADVPTSRVNSLDSLFFPNP